MRALANPTPLAWLMTALDILESWPDPLPIPPDAPRVEWRYLLFLRVTCEALEVAYSRVWKQGWATHCPLADAPDPLATSRLLRSVREHIPPSAAGLGALLLGLRLPEAGQACVYEALACGVDWVNPQKFWAVFNQPPVPAPAPAPIIVPASNRDAVVSHPIATPTDSPPASNDDPLVAIVSAVLADWITHPCFNRQAGDGWWTGDLYVAAKPFAEALQAHDGIKAQPGLSRDRKILYSQLAKQGLIVPNGGERIWKCCVTESVPEQKQLHTRYVSALKITPVLYQGLELGPRFQGTLGLAAS